jgi:hypothetical protein
MAGQPRLIEVPMRQAHTARARVAALTWRLACVPAASESRLVGLWRKLIHELFDPYRPERHYMRGPGPKWYAKHEITKPG